MISRNKCRTARRDFIAEVDEQRAKLQSLYTTLLRYFVYSQFYRRREARSYSTVTLLARLRGLSTFRPRALSTW